MIGIREEKTLKAFGKNLKTIRLGKKMSIRKLALEADMDWSHLAKIEKGQYNPTMLTITALAEALQVHPGDFFPRK